MSSAHQGRKVSSPIEAVGGTISTVGSTTTKPNFLAARWESIASAPGRHPPVREDRRACPMFVRATTPQRAGSAILRDLGYSGEQIREWDRATARAPDRGDDFRRPYPSHLRQQTTRRKDGAMSADTRPKELGVGELSEVDEPAF